MSNFNKDFLNYFLSKIVVKCFKIDDFLAKNTCMYFLHYFLSIKFKPDKKEYDDKHMMQEIIYCIIQDR